MNFAKKFILSGVLVFVAPGSTSQLWVALMISFYFFALLCRTMPYLVQKTDIAAVVAEANLFFTILVRAHASTTTILWTPDDSRMRVFRLSDRMRMLTVHVDAEAKSCRGVPDADVLRRRDVHIQLDGVDCTIVHRNCAQSAAIGDRVC